MTGMTTVFEVSAILLLHVRGITCLHDRGQQSWFGSHCILCLYTRCAKANFLHLSTLNVLQRLCHSAHACATVHAVDPQCNFTHGYTPPPYYKMYERA
jgi:hypothetical protein